MRLIPKPSTEKKPKTIRALHENDPIAEIYCDGSIRFAERELPVGIVAELVTVAKNFNLFYCNLGEK